METTTKTDWYCACGTYNKAAWGVCPVCEKRREDLAGPSAQQRAEQRHAAVAGVKRATSNTFYGVVGLVVALAVLAGLAFGGWKGWQYAEQRWFSDDKETAAETTKPLTDEQLLAKHIVAPGKPFGSVPMPKGGRLEDLAELSAAQRAEMGYQAGIAKMWLDPDSGKFAVTGVMEFDSSRIPPSKVRVVAEGFMQHRRTRTFKTALPGALGLAGRQRVDGHYTTSVTIVRGTRVAWVAFGTKQPATPADIERLTAFAAKQYSHL